MEMLSECWMALKMEKSMHLQSPMKENTSLVEEKINSSSYGAMMKDYNSMSEMDIQDLFRDYSSVLTKSSLFQ